MKEWNLREKNREKVKYYNGWMKKLINRIVFLSLLSYPDSFSYWIVMDFCNLRRSAVIILFLNGRFLEHIVCHANQLFHGVLDWSLLRTWWSGKVAIGAESWKRFARGRSLSCSTHVKSLSWHNWFVADCCRPLENGIRPFEVVICNFRIWEY